MGDAAHSESGLPLETVYGPGAPDGFDTATILPPLREALKLRATGGEVAHALPDVWASTSRTTGSEAR